MSGAPVLRVRNPDLLVDWLLLGHQLGAPRTDHVLDERITVPVRSVDRWEIPWDHNGPVPHDPLFPVATTDHYGSVHHRRGVVLHRPRGKADAPPRPLHRDIGSHGAAHHSCRSPDCQRSNDHLTRANVPMVMVIPPCRGRIRHKGKHKRYHHNFKEPFHLALSFRKAHMGLVS